MHLPLCAVRESGFTRFKDEMVSKVSSLGELIMQDSMLNSFYLPKSRWCKMLDTQWYLNSRFGQCKMAAKITRHWEARICKRYVYQWYGERKKNFVLTILEKLQFSSSILMINNKYMWHHLRFSIDFWSPPSPASRAEHHHFHLLLARTKLLLESHKLFSGWINGASL